MPENDGLSQPGGKVIKPVRIRDHALPMVQQGQEWTAVDSFHGLDWDKDLRGWLQVIYRRIWLVFLVWVLVFLVAVGYVLTRTPVFESSAIVQIVGLIPLSPYSIGFQRFNHSASFMHTEMTVLGSRQLVTDFFDHATVPYSDDFSDAGPSLIRPILLKIQELFGWDIAVDGQADSSSGRIESKLDLVADFRKRLKIKKLQDGTRPGSNMVKVTVEANRPEKAQKQLVAYLDFYERNNLKKIREGVKSNLEGLEKQLATEEEKLNHCESDLLDFVKEHGMLSKTDSGIERLMQLFNKSVEKISEAKEEQKKIQALSDGHSQSPGISRSKGDQDELVNELKRKLASLQSEYSEMSALYSPNYPGVVILRKKTEKLKKKLEEAQAKDVANALDMARKEEAVLRETMAETKKEAAYLNALEAKYALLKQRLDTAKKSYERVLKARDDSNIRLGTIYPGFCE